MLRWMTPWKQKWALSVSSFNFPALIFSQFCGREKKKKSQLKQTGICLRQLIFRKAGRRLIMHLNALPSRTNRMYGGKNTGVLMTNVSDLDDAHLDSWTQNMSVKQTTVEGLLKWWCGYGCNGHGVRWVRGRLGGGRQVNVNTRELEWVSTTQPCTLLAIMEMQFSEDALTSALKHDRLICYKWGGGALS